jgi:aspartyl-tRNA synthetase
VGELATKKRTHYCGDLRRDHIGQIVVLKGWVHRRRDHGGLIFIDLRDRTGLCQVVLNPETMNRDDFDKAHALRNEYVLAVEGCVNARPEGTVNPNIATGEIEVPANHFELLNPAAPLPFRLDEYTAVNEDVRLRYRYLDLRREEMRRNILTRANLYSVVRNYLNAQGFIEVETPILTKSTPEGARDFLVPSRLTPGRFYALPQSPQLFKQLLMVAGYDKYYQIARCFRDEDFRANRQPEFTQIDIEMSFIVPDDLFGVIEGLMQAIYRQICAIAVPVPFARLPYAEAMRRYGTDKPDVRFAMTIEDATDIMEQGCEFQVFNDVRKAGGVIRGLCVPAGASKISRKQLDDLTGFVGTYGAKGLVWFRVADEGLGSPVAKYFATDTLTALTDRMKAKPGDLLLFVADSEPVVCMALANLRLNLGNELALIDANKQAFVWVVDFPMLVWDDKERRFMAAHHPFTSPVPEDIQLLETAPERVRALAYDLVLNGEEIGGGSIRIHRRDVQEKVFRAIGISPEEAQTRFGFLLEALSFGAPPHGGIAFGFDRILMILLGEQSIREVIPFPKTQSGLCPLTGAPSDVDDGQLRELHIKTIVDNIR